MKNILLVLILTLFVLQHDCKAQKKISGSVKGSLTDTSHKELTANATISVLSSADSSAISHTLTDNKGAFSIKNLNAGAYILLASFQGYQSVEKNFSIPARNSVLDLGIINMGKANEMLEEVIVERPPII